jgi:hypothetical protein
LVKFRGPHSFRSGVAWAAFQGIRPAIIFSAIQRREATFISSEEWCSIPWQSHAKAPWQRVIDIMGQVPELLENLDELQRIPSYENWQVRKSQLLEHCCILDGVLQAWYQDLPSSFGLETSAELWYTRTSSHADSPFPTEIHFEDQIHGLALILYWATCVLVYSTMQRIYQGPTSTAASDVKPVLVSGNNVVSTRTDPYYCAARIVQSIPYFLQPSVGLLTRKIFTFPLATAYAYFASFPTRSSTRFSSSTSESPASTVTGASGFDDLTTTQKSDLTSEAGDIDHCFTQSYIETTAKAMHIKGLQINSLCGPSTPDHGLTLKGSD